MDKIINAKIIKDMFTKSGDVVVRPIRINHDEFMVHIFCVDGLTDSALLDVAILRPMSLDQGFSNCKSEREIMDYMLEGGAYHVFISENDNFDALITAVLGGSAALIFDQEQKAIIIDVKSFDKRGIQEPPDEGVMKGAKDSFIESMRSNTGLIRRRIRSRHLVVDQMSVGSISNNDVCLMYLDHVADMNIVNQIKQKIKDIDIDNVSTPAFIEEFVVENKHSIFPQIMYTQRPDRASANITDGRIVMIVDGIPHAYILPCQLPMLLQSPEDYANHYIVGSSLRLLRYLSMIITFLLPAFYIAAVSYQNQMLPVQLANAIQLEKVNVPFSSALEVLGLLIAFEVLIEAGLRLPKTVGTAMSILGGLVVGQSAVEAGLITPAVVVIIALSGIAGFIMPNQDLNSAIRVIRFGFAILAAMAGFFGLLIGLILLITHICSLDNYGVAYLSPFVDIDELNHRDTLFRFPVKFFKRRPDKVAKNNVIKQK